MKYITLSLFILLSAFAYNQTSTDIGFFAGTTQYWGDLNPRRIIYSPDVAGGFVCRYNINKRHSVRFNTIYSYLEVNEIDEQAKNSEKTNKMSTSLLHFALIGEFNFLPIIPKNRYDKGAAFLSAGVGYSLQNSFCIPFGVGYKHYLTDRIGITGELTFNKPFYDDLDNVSYNRNLLNNNDWYTFAGISITYVFYNSRTSCPVYD